MQCKQSVMCTFRCDFGIISTSWPISNIHSNMDMEVSYDGDIFIYFFALVLRYSERLWLNDDIYLTTLTTAKSEFSDKYK